MVAVLIPALLVSLVAAERPTGETDPNDRLELSSHGHFVAKRPIEELATGELDHVDDKSKPEGSVHPPATNLSGSLIQAGVKAVDQLRDEESEPPEDRKARLQGIQGCTQGTTGTSTCQSLCYRVWCDPEKWGICADFDRELREVSNDDWVQPEARRTQGGFFWTSKDKQMDQWYEDMRRNIPGYHINHYMDGLTKYQDYDHGGGMTAKVEAEFHRPITKVLNAFKLRRAYDDAQEAMTKDNRRKAAGIANIEKCTAKLQSAINEVESCPFSFYPAMQRGLDETRALAEKMSIYAKMKKAMQQATALAKSTDEKVDNVLSDLGQYCIGSQAAAKRVMDAEFRPDIKECEAKYKQLKDNLTKHFSKQIQSADDAVYGGDSLVDAMVSLKPLIKRMEKLSPMFDGPAGLEKARSTLESMQGKVRQNYKDKVLAAQESIARVADKEELRLVQQDIENLFQECQSESMYKEFKDDYTALDDELARVKALQLYKDAMEEYEKVNIKIKEFESGQGSSLAEVRQAIPDDFDDVDSTYEDATGDKAPVSSPKIKASPAVSPVTTRKKANMVIQERPIESAAGRAAQMAPVAEEALPAPREKTPAEKRLETQKDRVMGKLRRAFDACTCAEMPDSLQGEIDKAQEGCEDLGDCPVAVSCPAKQSSCKAIQGPGEEAAASEEKSKGGKASKAWHKKLLGGIFGGTPRSAQPAALASLLFALLLTLHVL